MITLKLKGGTYGVSPMPPMKAAGFGLKVVQVFSPILADPATLEILNSLKDLAGKKEVDSAEAFTSGMKLLSILKNIDADKLNAILQEAFSHEVWADTVRLSDPVNFDMHFQKNPGDLYIVGIWATWNHIKDFFAGLGDGMSALMKSSGKGQNIPQSPSPKA